jgi:hypothetical protein
VIPEKVFFMLARQQAGWALSLDIGEKRKTFCVEIEIRFLDHATCSLVAIPTDRSRLL